MKLLTMLIGVTLISCGYLPGGKKDSGSSSSKTAENESGKIHSMALDSKDDLSECTVLNNKQLAYIIDEEQFYVCNDLEWAAIDIKGKDGKDGEPLDDHHFLDKVTGYVWQEGAEMSWSNAMSACPGGDWEVPTKQEALDVWKHGLNPTNGMWTSEASSSSGAYYVDSSVPSVGSKSTLRSSVCVKK